MRLNAPRAFGVNRRTRRSRSTITMGMSALVTRFRRSFPSSFTSWYRACSSSLTVVSSSFVDWSSSFAVSSSSFADWSSSFAAWSSSFDSASSWFLTACCSTTVLT